MVIYEENKEELKEYNIERPLWIFVGSKVSGKGINSDIVQIITYFKEILKDENLLREKIEKIINEKTGLIDQNGNDIFKGKYEYIKERYKLEEIIDGIYQKVFKGRGKLDFLNKKCRWRNGSKNHYRRKILWGYKCREYIRNYTHLFCPYLHTII